MRSGRLDHVPHRFPCSARDRRGINHPSGRPPAAGPVPSRKESRHDGHYRRFGRPCGRKRPRPGRRALVPARLAVDFLHKYPDRRPGSRAGRLLPGGILRSDGYAKARLGRYADGIGRFADLDARFYAGERERLGLSLYFVPFRGGSGFAPPVPMDRVPRKRTDASAVSFQDQTVSVRQSRPVPARHRHDRPDLHPRILPHAGDRHDGAARGTHYKRPCHRFHDLLRACRQRRRQAGPAYILGHR